MNLPTFPLGHAEIDLFTLVIFNSLLFCLFSDNVALFLCITECLIFVCM